MMVILMDNHTICTSLVDPTSQWDEILSSQWCRIWIKKFSFFISRRKGKVQGPVIESMDEVKVREEMIKKPVTSWQRMVRIKRDPSSQTEARSTTDFSLYAQMCRGKKDGRYIVPRNCRAYISCENGTGTLGRCHNQTEYFSETKDDCVFELELSPKRKKDCQM